DHGSLWDRDQCVVAGCAVPSLAHAVGAVGRAPMRMVLEREERGDVPIGDQPDVTAAAAIAAIGPALGHVRFTPERDRTRAAIAALHMQATLVDETGHDDCRLRGAPARARDEI